MTTYDNMHMSTTDTRLSRMEDILINQGVGVLKKN